MDSTGKSENKYFISEELLDDLIHEYMTASGNYQGSRKSLLNEDPESIKNNMLAAHGMGHMLLHIMTKIPKEMIHGISTREFVWKAITGTDCRTDRGQGREGATATDRRGKGTGQRAWLPFRGR